MYAINANSSIIGMVVPAKVGPVLHAREEHLALFQMIVLTAVHLLAIS